MAHPGLNMPDLARIQVRHLPRSPHLTLPPSPTFPHLLPPSPTFSHVPELARIQGEVWNGLTDVARQVPPSPRTPLPSPHLHSKHREPT